MQLVHQFNRFLANMISHSYKHSRDLLQYLKVNRIAFKNMLKGAIKISGGAASQHV